MKRRTAVNKRRLFTGAKGLDVGHNLPAIFNGDGCVQRRLASTGNAVADILEKYAGRAVLNFGAAQVGGQWGKALADSTIAIVIVTMALGTIDQVYAFAAGNDSRLVHIEGGLNIGSGRYPEDGFATIHRDQTGFFDQQRLFVRSHGRCFTHTAVAKVVVIIDQRVVDRQDKNGDNDKKSNCLLHLFNTIKRDHVQMFWVFFLALLFEHMLRVGQGIIGIIDCIGRFPGNVFDRPIIPIRLAEISDNRKRQPALEYDDGNKKKNQQPGFKSGCLMIWMFH